MSKAEKAAIQTRAAKFVQEVVVEVYGQPRPSQKKLTETANRVADTIISAKIGSKEQAGREAR